MQRDPHGNEDPDPSSKGVVNLPRLDGFGDRIIEG